MAEPIPPAHTPSLLPKKATVRRMNASPRWAYPSGIGIWTIIVIIQITAAIRAPLQREKVFILDFIAVHLLIFS